MKNKIIAAALTEMEIHSLRFTMEDLTRRLRIGRNSLYKIVSSKTNKFFLQRDDGHRGRFGLVRLEGTTLPLGGAVFLLRQ